MHEAYFFFILSLRGLIVMRISLFRYILRYPISETANLLPRAKPEGVFAMGLRLQV